MSRSTPACKARRRAMWVKSRTQGHATFHTWLVFAFRFVIFVVQGALERSLLNALEVPNDGLDAGFDGRRV